MSNPLRIRPVVLSGGSGTRLWPMSRELHPKQLLPLAGIASMLCETLTRFADAARFARPIVMTNDALRFSVAEEVRLSALESTIVLEPSARNTAPAIAAAALLAQEEDPDAIIMVVPSDHLIRDLPGFLAKVADALPAAVAGNLVTFALRPTRAETGFGYIRLGEAIAGTNGVYRVASFVEKPDAERARALVADGLHYWNGGMFLFSARDYWRELERHAPAVCAPVKDAVAARRVDLDFVRLDAKAFDRAPNISIDYAVMEKTDRAATVVCDIGWSDIGSWSELWEVGAKDADGNVIVGDVIVESSRDSYLRSEGPLTAILGVNKLVVVVTDDAVLIADRDRVQNVKLIVDRLRRANRPEPATHLRSYRPWGYLQSLHQGHRFQVKRLTIKPGAKISLQKHHHRAEHWVVVSGTAMVTRNAEQVMLGENESIYIPRGAVHRLENPGKVPLNVIEVQSGEYLGEDDIVRIEDSYGRV
jgi:mannose-1-phosphate guanylyltransferase/mannose-1-phosphate guanylyltransferase/mannose-6-phosphate isomerase